jgi:hypothetical protein
MKTPRRFVLPPRGPSPAVSALRLAFSCLMYSPSSAADSARSVFCFPNSAFNDCHALTDVILAESHIVETRMSLSPHSRLKFPRLLDIIQGFRNCTALKAITVPAFVRRILSEAFENCTSLSRVDFEHRSQLQHIAGFQKCTSLLHLEIPPSVVSLYLTAFEDSSGQSEIVFPRDTQIEGVYFTGELRRHVFLAFDCDFLKLRRRIVHRARSPFLLPGEV